MAPGADAGLALPSFWGLAVFVNSCWCNPGHIHGKKHVCSPSIELIAIGMGPHYLPREFTNVIAVSVYIPPSGKVDAACNIIHQFVKCTTGENRTLDLLFADIKKVYISSALPPLGRTDHNLVLLTPEYKPAVKQQHVTERTVSKWSPEGLKALMWCIGSH